MSKFSTGIALGIPVLSALGASFIAALPASAFVVNGGSITLGTGDVNKSFDVFFNGSVNTNLVGGLSSKATFTFLGFTTVGNNTEAAFSILLDDTSSNGITSRVSALGFDVNRTLVGIGNSGGSGNTRVSGLFTNDRTGSFPNQFGDVSVCFTNGNTCQGGQNGGVKTNDPAGSFSATLAYSGTTQEITLSGLGVRYQSIDGSGFNGASGTGMGTIRVTPTPPPSPEPETVPEPSAIGALMLTGLAALKSGRKRKENA